MDKQFLVVLVNYGLADHVERLLTSGVLARDRVLLVDNCSEPDRVTHLARCYGAEALLLRRNCGFAGAVNRAIVHSEHDGPVLLLNPDVHLAASDLGDLRRALADGGFTAVTPLLVTGDGFPHVGTAGGPVSLAGFVRYFLFWSHLRPRSRGAFYTRAQLAAGLAPEWVSMACLVLAPDAFRRYGPIPEHEIVYAEDVAWGWAASRAGARFGVATAVRVVHEQGASGASPRWRAATARLAVRELGHVRGRIAAGVMWLGLVARRALGRRV